MKLRSIVAGAVAATSFAAPAMATPQGQFPDVQPTNWAYQAILNLKERYGCAEGFPDGTFRPGEAATRAQMAALTNHCLTNIVQFYTAADAALAAALRVEYGPRLTALEVDEQRRNYQIGNYVGLGFTGYSDDTVEWRLHLLVLPSFGRARVYQWDNNAAISLRPELTFNDTTQTLLGWGRTLDFLGS
jgi:S-layer homology domain.